MVYVLPTEIVVSFDDISGSVEFVATDADKLNILVFWILGHDIELIQCIGTLGAFGCPEI